MAETVVLKTKPRNEFGSVSARRLRQQGLLPALVYGHKEETLTVVLPREEVEKVIKRGIRIVTIEAGGKTETARFRELQWDHIGKEILHVDFMRVSKDERIVVAIRIELRGVCPGLGEGGVLDQPLHNLQVECPALEIPEFVRVQVDTLHIDDAVHVRDLLLPPGVIAKADPDAVVCIVKHKKEEVVAPAPAAATEETAEPEVIKKAPVKEEEAAEE